MKILIRFIQAMLVATFVFALSLSPEMPVLWRTGLLTFAAFLFTMIWPNED